MATIPPIQLDLLDHGAVPFQPASLVFVRHRRAKRYLICVRADGTVRVTIPRWGSRREARAFADRESAWIDRQRARVFQEQRQSRELPSAALARDLRAQARRELPVRLMELAAQHGLRVSRVSIRNQRWRWGSCSRNGHICLNWRLVQLPASVRDYVLLHELVHLKEMSHSPRFWTLLAEVCPEYHDARRYLRAQPVV